MDELITSVNWLAVIVGTLVAFGLGGLWYSPKMFGDKWAKGNDLKKEDCKNMTSAMVSQFFATFLLAWLVGVTAKNNAVFTVILITVVIIALLASNGKWAKKPCAVVVIDTSFVLVMVVIMVFAQAVL